MSKKKENKKTYRIGGSRVTEGAIIGGLSGLGFGKIEGKRSLEAALKNPQFSAAYKYADPTKQKALKTFLSSGSISNKMIQGLLWGSIIGSMVPRTKKFTDKQVKDIRKKREKEYNSKYANLLEGTTEMENLSKAEIVFEKTAGKGKVIKQYIIDPLKKWWKGSKPNKSGYKADTPPANPPTPDDIQWEKAKKLFKQDVKKVKEKAKQWAYPVGGLTAAYVTATYSNKWKQDQLADIQNQVAANQNIKTFNPKDIKQLSNTAFADSLMTNDQLKVLEGVKDDKERLAVREGLDNWNQMMWTYSDPALVEAGIPKSVELKDYRKNLYDAGKLKPWTDKSSKDYNDQMLIPGVNYNYKK